MKLVDLALGTGAVLIAAFTVTSVVRGRTPAVATPIAPEYVSDAAAYATAGIVSGDSTAPIRVVEFFDFECFYCARMQPAIDSLLAARSSQIQIVYRHFPRSRVGMAMPAAIATECVVQRENVRPWFTKIYGSFSQLTPASLDSIALNSSSADSTKTLNCLRSRQARERVETDLRAGHALGIAGTPAFLIGDSLYTGEMLPGQLAGIIELAPIQWTLG